MNKLAQFGTIGTKKHILMKIVLLRFDLLKTGSGRAPKCLWFRIKKTTTNPQLTSTQASNGQHEIIIPENFYL